MTSSDSLLRGVRWLLERQNPRGLMGRNRVHRQRISESFLHALPPVSALFSRCWRWLISGRGWPKEITEEGPPLTLHGGELSACGAPSAVGLTGAAARRRKSVPAPCGTFLDAQGSETLLSVWCHILQSVTY